MGDGPPSLCDCVPMAGPAWPPGPRSEQLCPLHPQAAQPLGALVPRATPRPAGPTGQVLALALGQVTHLLSPRLLGVSASVPRRPSRICINPPREGPEGEGVGYQHTLAIASRPSGLGGKAPVSPQTSPGLGPRAQASAEQPEGLLVGGRRGPTLHRGSSSFFPVRWESLASRGQGGNQEARTHLHTPCRVRPDTDQFTRAQVKAR